MQPQTAHKEEAALSWVTSPISDLLVWICKQHTSYLTY